MKENIKYKHSPLVEVVCEIIFTSEETFNSDNKAKFEKLIYKDYPNSEIRKNFTVELKQENNNVLSSVNEENFLTQYKHPDKTTLVQLGHNILTINQLAPYSAWEDYFPIIKKTYKSYIEIFKPTSIARIGLRFINLIKIKDFNNKSELKDYFNYLIQLPNHDSKNISALNLTTDFNVNNGLDMLKLILVTLKSEANLSQDFILDIDYHNLNPQSVDVKLVEKWLKTAKDCIYNTFENSLTENLKNQFK